MLPCLQVRVLDVTKDGKVNVTQKTEEEARQEKKMADEGFGTTSLSGVTNTLQAALARAGIVREAFTTEV